MATRYGIWCIFFLWISLCHLCGGKVQICPESCICKDGHIEDLTCHVTSVDNWKKTCSEIKEEGRHDEILIDLKIQLLDSTLFPLLPFQCLPRLNSLDLAQLALKEVGQSTFQNVDIISQLDLSQNGLTSLLFDVFSVLEDVQSLNLSHNLIHTLSGQIFNSLLHLKSLDLSHNKLVEIKPMTFTNLTNLRYLNLANNGLAFISVWHLPTSANLRTLLLQGNNLQGLDLDIANESDARINSLSALDISSNPLDCSCALGHVIKLLHLPQQTLRNAVATSCKTPEQLNNAPVLSLNSTDMVCSSPKNVISYPSNEKNVLFRETIKLECKSDGYPPPSVIWQTPWGETFSRSVQTPRVRQWGFAVEELLLRRRYKEINVDLVTTIQVDEKNDLVISPFRGSMRGNYSCLVFNVAGHKTRSMSLSIISMVKPVYIHSLFIGGYTASGLLIFAFIVGFIKMNVVRLRHKNCFTVPIFSTTTSVRPAKDTMSTHCDSMGRDYANFSDFSPCSVEFESESLAKDFSQSGEATEKKSHIKFESLEEAKGRLRLGVGRKVESMKRNVQSIKHSSSAYVQTIKESGSSAASRMKASVALGMETVKSHVQSFKELCGTGDMGMHTISMVSVETDIDTNQQTNVVKQITYV